MHNLIVNHRTIVPFTFKDACTEGMHSQIKGHESLQYFKLKQVQNSLITENILLQDNLLPVFQHGFLRSAENVDLHNLVGVVWGNVNLHNITNVVYVVL